METTNTDVLRQAYQTLLDRDDANRNSVLQEFWNGFLVISGAVEEEKAQVTVEECEQYPVEEGVNAIAFFILALFNGLGNGISNL